MKRMISLLAVLLLSIPAFAQMINEGDVAFGLKGSYINSKLQGIWGSIKPSTEIADVAIDLSDELWRNGFSVDGFFQWWPQLDFPVTGTLEGSYSRLGGIVKLGVDNPTFSPTPYNNYYEFIYDFFQISGLVNFHPGLKPGKRGKEHSWASGIKITFGPQYAWSIHKNQIAKFSSTNPNLTVTEIEAIEDDLNDFFESTSYFAGVLGLGYQWFFDDINFGFELNGRIIYGFGDSVITRENFRGYEDKTVESITRALSFGIMYRFIKGKTN